MLNEDYPYPEQYQSLGRVVNAVIHSLGPELKTTSQSMQRCTVIIEELMFHDQPLVQLEAINFRQSQLLFAPQTINASSIGPALRPHLTSSYLVLRQATITCLRQLIHVDLSEISSDSFIHEFFMMVLIIHVPHFSWTAKEIPNSETNYNFFWPRCWKC